MYLYFRSNEWLQVVCDRQLIYPGAQNSTEQKADGEIKIPLYRAEKSLEQVASK